MSEANDVLESAYYGSLLGYDNVDWFADEVTKLENKMNFYIKNTNKNLIRTEKDEKRYSIIEIISFVDFVRKKYILIRL